MLDQLEKTASLLDLTHFVITIDPQNVVIRGANPTNTLAHSFELLIAAKDITRNDPAFTHSMRFRIAELFLLMDGGYSVALSEKWSYVYLAHDSLPIVYHVAADPSERHVE